MVVAPDAKALRAGLQSPALATAGTLRSVSAAPQLKSCDRRLADAPGAGPFVQRGERALTTAGILTQAQIDDGGTSLYLSDDPTRNGQVFFTVLLSRPIDISKPDLPPLQDALKPYVVAMSVGNAEVLEVHGSAAWFFGK